MKKQMSLFVWAVAVFGMSNVWAATDFGMGGASSADLTGEPGVRSNEYVNYHKYETRSTNTNYEAKLNKDIYYKQPSKRSEMYKNYKGCAGENCESTYVTQDFVRTSRVEVGRTEAKRKYYLAHPFFQPLKGRIGSVTDLSSITSSYDVTVTPFVGNSISDANAQWKTSKTAIKEDLSYGITDTVALVGSVRYASSKYKMDWSLPATPDDENSDSSVDVWGLGAQYRFVDNNEWIATLSGFYQNNVDIAGSFLGDIKGGYKVGNSTIYGVGRVWLLNFEQSAYGDGIENNGTAIFMAYNTNDNTAFYLEGGAGIFSVLDKDWTLNLEMLIGNYDWHNQGSIKAAIGWQPNDMFALNLYFKTTIYDSADGKNLDFWVIQPGDTYWSQLGTANIQNYSEQSIGVQATLYF